MSTRFGALVAAVLAIAATAPSAPPPKTAILPVAARGQKQDYWCWAATTEMIARYVDPSVDTIKTRQCAQAGTKAGKDCCASPLADKCNSGGWPRFDLLGFKTPKVTKDKPLSWSQLKDEIDKNRPVAYSWHWLDDGVETRTGHMVAVVGYHEAGADSIVYIDNPWPVPNGKPLLKMTYSEYVSEPRRRSHWNDYYEIRK